MRIALTIAGSDSGGGAGIQADLKTFAAFGVFGTSAITAVTAQNTLGVFRAVALDPSLVEAQIRAVAEDLRPQAVKTGMLANAAVVAAVAQAAESFGLRPLVVDPVMVASSGDVLLEPAAVAAIRDRLLPLAALVTPNLAEAEVLTGRAVRSEEEMRAAAAALVAMGARAALVKGGHLPGDDMVDILHDGRDLHALRASRLPANNPHGTGCTLSAGITAALARGCDLLPAVRAAVDFVRRAIAAAPGLGSGRGPLNHLIRPRPPE
ncbi:MAG: bifunctional hydroxymethylpyrimidine kinase/phosphomethylpyrimidine kinase [Armatimonadetes bacterium]|nr:bifunctional hydroxymethylpyrimidine kinase/phosphomethylpyrimidine kinase [Armatimonadota bacterium]